MSWSQTYPNSFSPTQQTQEVLKNTDNETKKIYQIVSEIMAADGHAHTGSGSDGAPIDGNDLSYTPSGSISETTISGAIAELDTEKSSIAQLQDYSFVLKPGGIIAKGPWVDVRAFGAIGNGTHDDTEAFEAAVNYAADHSLPLLVPKLSYNLAATVFVNDVEVIDYGAYPNKSLCTNNSKWLRKDSPRREYFGFSNIPRTDTVWANQGCAYIEGKGEIAFGYNDPAVDHYATIVIRDSVTLEIKRTYTNLELYHCADLSYNQDKDELYASPHVTGMNTKIIVLDYDTMTIKSTVDIGHFSSLHAYDNKNQLFITAIDATFYFQDDNFNLVKTITVDYPYNPNYVQSIDCYNDTIIILENNYIRIFSYNGKLLRQFPLSYVGESQGIASLGNGEIVITALPLLSWVGGFKSSGMFFKINLNDNKDISVVNSQFYIPISIVVDGSNTTGIEDGTVAHPFKFLRSALDYIAFVGVSEATVTVKSGTYNEDLGVRDMRNLYLEINGETTFSVTGQITCYRCRYVKISNAVTTFAGDNAIINDRTTDLELVNVTTTGAGLRGVTCYGGKITARSCVTSNKTYAYDVQESGVIHYHGASGSTNSYGARCLEAGYILGTEASTFYTTAKYLIASNGTYITGGKAYV
jgi:hypothetical protein